MADRPGHDRRYALAAGKIRRELGEAADRFEHGLEETVAWCGPSLVERFSPGNTGHITNHSTLRAWKGKNRRPATGRSFFISLIFEREEGAGVYLGKIMAIIVVRLLMLILLYGREAGENDTE